MTDRLLYEKLWWPDRPALVAAADDDGLWQAYAETQVMINYPSGSVHVIPVPPGESLPVAAEACHVITACDPASQGDRDEDDARMGLLADELKAYTVYDALGFHPTDSHQERSYAVLGLDDAAARDLGVRYGQVAIFALRGDTWSLISCATSRRLDQEWTAGPTPLRPRAERR